MPETVPILTYHSVSDQPESWIAPFTVTPQVFGEHLDAIAESGHRTLTVTAYAQLLRAGESPARSLLITFDDGFADTRELALPELARRGLHATAYLTTSFVEAQRGPYGDRMLSWDAARELHAAGIEIGAHSHTHPQLDTLTRKRARDEIVRSKTLIEDQLGRSVPSFAYPHGYSSAAVRRTVAAAGFETACAVGNALSHPGDDPLRLARILVTADTTRSDLEAWLRGERLAAAGPREAMRTRVWRYYRRAAVIAGIRSAVDL
jgi:peptidoglycan/xylan/chitin deacetylase (PgdA/CDA1 family)